MTIRYSPAAMARIREYQEDIARRVRDGSLSDAEGRELLAARVREETIGAVRKVRCPDCGKQHDLVGSGQTFTCCTAKVHSVWDCRA